MKVVTCNADKVLMSKNVFNGCLHKMENGEIVRIMRATPDQVIDVDETYYGNGIDSIIFLGLRKVTGHKDYQYLGFTLKPSSFWPKEDEK